MPITFTLDVEDHRAAPGDPARHLVMTREILEFLGERGIRGTFFMIGDVAEEDPSLAVEIAAAGHELAVHGFRHEPLPEVGPERFREEVRATKHHLEDLVQQPVVGFRAPMFSLVQESRWAVDALTEIGFVYSSSLMPIHHPLYGDPSLPARPFLWSTGLVELPCPVVHVGPAGLPWLGAVWLRNLPWPMIRAGLLAMRAQDGLWTYAHPYDFDPEEPFRVLDEAGQVGSRLIWRHRARMFDKFDRLLRGRVAPPLVERAEELVSLPEVSTVGGA